MASSPDGDSRPTVGHIVNREARRRAFEVSKVGLIVVITILATLVFTGHRMAPDCVRAIVCIERDVH